MSKTKLFWSLQIGGWIFYAIIVVFGASLASENFSANLAIPIIMEAFFLLLITQFFRYYSKQQQWLKLNVNKLLPKVILSIILMAFTVYYVRVLVSYWLGLYTPDLLSWNNVLGNAIGNIIVLLIWSSIYFAYHYFERYNQSLKYEVAMNEMKLNQLKSQLNPHFIFNALNSIRALVDEEPSKSKKAINHLSNMLRSSLAADKKKLTSLGDEIKTVKDYLALESIRFEERLDTQFDINENSESFLVPPLMIQTLVENGIKHGISKLKKGGRIALSSIVDEKGLKIEIRNTGQLNLNGSKRLGYGIKNTQQRLDLIYDERATFEIINADEHTVLVTVRIPN
jgi:two-component system LytT family sensor kinase